MRGNADMRGEGPEHISEILKRVFEDLEKQYGEKIGGWSKGPSGDALHVPGPLSLAGGGSIGRLDKIIPPAYNKRLAEKS